MIFIFDNTSPLNEGFFLSFGNFIQSHFLLGHVCLGYNS